MVNEQTLNRASDEFKKTLLKYIDEYKPYMQRKQYGDLYDKLASEIPSSYSQAIRYIILKSGINPLQDIDFIPRFFMSGFNIQNSFTIPSHIKEIHKCAFQDCPTLEEVFIPNSVVEINYHAFDCCPMLEKLRYDGTIEQWNKIQKVSWMRGCPLLHIICTDGSV